MMGTILIAGFALLVFAVGGTAGVMSLVGNRRTSGDRLRDLTSGKSRAELEAAREAKLAEAVAERLSKLATPTDDEQANLLRRKMIHAGYRNRNAAEIFNGIRVGLVFVLPLLGIPLLSLNFSIYYIMGGAIVLACVGYFVPMMMLNSQVEARHRKLLAPFPDALDLLVTSVEAGLALDMAFRRVADEIRSAAPELALEFQLVNHEVSAGIPRLEAFRHLADRTGLDEVKSLVNMMVQAERFGTSIATALRIHGDLVRQKRMAKAEEEAAKVSPKLTIIMILFLMPALVIVLLGPAIIRVRDALAR